MALSFAQLRSFHAVAVKGTVTEAARFLRVTQPAVTAQLNALERESGAELFVRTGRQVHLTESGQELLAISRRMFDLEREAEELLTSLGELSAGHLRVGADGPFHILENLKLFSHRFPGVRISVSIGNSAEVKKRLLEYETDIAVLAQLEEHDPRFFTIAQRPYPIVAFVNHEHPWSKRQSIRLAELENQPMVHRESGSTTRQAFERALNRHQIRPRFVMEIGSREGIREAVALGLGIGVISAEELGCDQRLHALPIEDVDVSAPERVVCLKERSNSRVVNAFREICYPDACMEPPPETAKPTEVATRSSW